MVPALRGSGSYPGLVLATRVRGCGGRTGALEHQSAPCKALKSPPAPPEPHRRKPLASVTRREPAGEWLSTRAPRARSRKPVRPLRAPTRRGDPTGRLQMPPCDPLAPPGGLSCPGGGSSRGGAARPLSGAENPFCRKGSWITPGASGTRTRSHRGVPGDRTIVSPRAVPAARPTTPPAVPPRAPSPTCRSAREDPTPNAPCRSSGTLGRDRAPGRTGGPWHGA